MDEEALRASLAELRQQEEGIKGLLALNPQSDELSSLLSQVGEARSMTESALLALCQSRLLESIESTAPAPPPPPSLPSVGAVVSARYAETGKHYQALVEAHVSPTVARLSWAHLPRPKWPCFYSTAHALAPYVAPDRRALVVGATCLAQRTAGATWCCGRVVSRGGGGGSAAYLVEVRARRSDSGVDDDAAYEPRHDGLLPSRGLEQISLPQEQVVPAEYVVPLAMQLGDASDSEESGGEEEEDDDGSDGSDGSELEEAAEEATAGAVNGAQRGPSTRALVPTTHSCACLARG